MKRKYDVVPAGPFDRSMPIGADAMVPTTLKELRKRTGQTQEDMAAALGVGQDTISRLEKRSDMLLSTLRHYVECIGGQLELVATFPDHSAVIIDHHGEKSGAHKKRGRKSTEHTA
ncbi:transcriptional regulator [Pollutimonas nitritireducens]|uniref:Transcriptional regulator n=1 Tax=Pollutimonas nitritireducens TaxID=2045209 RepID=A0A2N4UJZ7_9BURK|nr:helix-turn-helix transcriptional regulator [Pollutimonas nitritireducens]PLC55295.1 transcriptional regulator [Pollutimonas nitritireducens]